MTKTSGGQTSVYVCANKMGYTPGTGLEVAEYTAGAAPANPSRTFVFESFADEPICMTSTGVISYYHRNGTHSTAAISDSTGALSECYAYSASGDTSILAPDGTTVRSTSAVGNPFMYTSRRFDAETGLYYFRARYYDSALGHFTSRDPLDYALRDYNLYRYCRNSPLTYHDPLGTFPEPQPAVQAGGCNATWQDVWVNFDGQFNDPDNLDCVNIPMAPFINYLQGGGCNLGPLTNGPGVGIGRGCVGICACLINCGSGNNMIRPEPDDQVIGPGGKRGTCFCGKNARKRAAGLAQQLQNNSKRPMKCVVFAKQGSWVGDVPNDESQCDPHDVAQGNFNFNYVTVMGDFCVSINQSNLVGPQVLTVCKSPSCEPESPRGQITVWCVSCRVCKGGGDLPTQ